MSIVLFRIDDRLIHGQVVEGWLKNIEADTIMIANDVVANDEMQKTLLSLAVPSNVEIIIENIEKCVDLFASGTLNNKRVLILVSSPKDAFLCIKDGIKIKCINVGGMHYSLGKKQILEAISVSEEDIKYFKNISEQGVKIEGKILPGEEKIDIIHEINNL